MKKNNSPRRIDSEYYEAVAPGSFAERVAVIARDRIYNDFIRWCAPTEEDTILDVGVSDIITKASNALERKYLFPAKITAAGLGAGEDFQATFPAVAYYQIEAGERLPFSDGQFTISTANAVLEHVGSLQKQINFISELHRVARKVFITVPNRFFPIDTTLQFPLCIGPTLDFDLHVS
ncbi:MAG: methyltransferase domain-containing protein [Spirochaetia bacterium]|jgi:SAM-dependent methyltransferase